MARKLAAGNWKMNGTRAALAELAAIADATKDASADILICPPATLVSAAAETVSGSKVAIGGQDCHAANSGAHTGDLSAEMLKDAGATAVILGHSERRTDHGETDIIVRAKTEAAQAQGLVAVVCIGETLDEREAGDTLKVAGSQLAGSLPDGIIGENTVVAYEPVWAIGTGKVPTLEQIGEVHDFLRAELVARFGDAIGNAIPLLYGGSVKPGNAAEIFGVSNVDGALVGGASLKAADFGPIAAAL
ncbi:triose-phosphate isomerase [Epibacterium sp. SM1979]|uniref:Triosephosphate isomerase n=1 Tax=Tritonibacter litoralis TaxID=2662264 RepID=A0A843YEB2_9RHOB|nr:triose-phosphate isomerase [Tritonibacter litoralis]MQQ07439.1 triose-phosphate isomerase [Tritonibacter litoralis]